MFFKTLIFTHFVVSFVTSNPIISSYSKSKAACEAFGDRPLGENSGTSLHSSNRALVGEFPSAVAIHYNNGGFLCTGVLISNRFVATSANCVKQTDRKCDFVRLGRTSYNLDDSSDLSAVVDVEIESSFIHPGFKQIQKQNNLALLKLKEPVNFTRFVFPACLNTAESSDDEETYVNAGFGNALIDGKIIGNSDWLLKITVNEVKLEDCQHYFYSKITEKNICAADMATFNDLCHGSSGGPLGRWEGERFYLHGTLSFGLGCGAKIPAVFTRISSHVPWIEEVVWADDNF